MDSGVGEFDFKGHYNNKKNLYNKLGIAVDPIPGHASSS